MIRKKDLKEKGITLIALVVTIIILLILAGVTLNIALSDNGLFSKTRDAADKYKQAQSGEEDMLTELEKQLEGYTDNKPSPSTSTEPTPTPEKLTGPSGKPLPKTIKEITTKNEEIEDSLGNQITIPKGFKFIGSDSDTVKDGIVIQDSDGNEFVWIPVSNIDGDNNAKTEPNNGNLITIDGNQKVEITLGRYEFDESNGEPSLKQSGSQCAESGHEIKNNYIENTTDKRTNGGEGAKDLQSFVDSVAANHGYYIARYEAGGKANNKLVSKAGQEVWVEITQPDASAAARGMYKDTMFESDLINSYAWDTAIVYIQSMGNDNYANRGIDETEVQSTGGNNDRVCNIYNLTGNTCEWTTEYGKASSDLENYPCIYRGSNYNYFVDTPSERGGYAVNSAEEGIRFPTTFIFKVALNAKKIIVMRKRKRY